MTIVGLIRLLRKHLVLLLFMPILLAGLVITLTKNPSFTFSSETTLYTGLASGSSVEMGKAISYFATTTDFDNLINVINSRQTQQEVAIRLIAQHLMLPKAEPSYISSKSFDYLRKITPAYVRQMVVTSGKQASVLNAETPKTDLDSLAKSILIKQAAQKDTTETIIQSDADSTFSFSKLYAPAKSSKMFPASIDESAYEQTVKNLTELFASNDTNFVYHLLNFDNPHYSFEAISTIVVQRIGSSDLVKLKYTADDPGICQQTLILLTNVLIKNYKVLKENRSDAVVKYFEYQVNQATQKLKLGEDKLLLFNKDNKIINYYEQSKAVAGAKEALDVDYNNMKIKLAGFEAEIKRLEEKLENQQKIYLKSVPIVDKRNQLAQISTKIATSEAIGIKDIAQIQNITLLKAKADKLKEEIRESVGDLYHFGNSTEGIPIATLLNEWISNVLKYEDMKAGQTVLAKRIQDFQKQYDIFAPAGANLKRIEREISVSEHEFLELLHGLNLAKLKMQDLELSSNLKAIDQPFFPITPNPTKRKFLIIGAAFFGFLIVFATIMALEFFDETLRNPNKAGKKLNLVPLGVYPKVYLKTEILNFTNITKRLLEMMVQKIELLKKEKASTHEPYQILLFSTSNNEGKTIIAQNLASLLKKVGNKVIIIRYSSENIKQQRTNLDYYAGVSMTSEIQKNPVRRFSWINWILGYPDDRVNYQSPFLSENGSTLLKEEFFEYTIDEHFLHLKDYKELLARNNHTLTFSPDYVLIEIPSILYYPYPTGLVLSADLPLMICRANRIWANADQGTFDNFSKVLSRTPFFILNGVEIDVVESILGELQKKRNWIRKIVKKIILFDFSSTTQP